MSRPAAHDVKLHCMMRVGPWPERMAFTCACCGVGAEVFVRIDDDSPLSERRVRMDIAVRAVSAMDWLLVKGRGRADWVCKPCVGTALDHRDPAFIDAADRWSRWAGVEYSLGEGVES